MVQSNYYLHSLFCLSSFFFVYIFQFNKKINSEILFSKLILSLYQQKMLIYICKSRAPIFDSTVQAVTSLSAQIRQPYGTRVVNLSAASVRT